MPATVNTTASAAAIGDQVGKAVRRAAPQPAHGYPRPPVVVLPADLFREPVYEDGQPYADGQDDEDDPDA